MADVDKRLETFDEVQAAVWFTSDENRQADRTASLDDITTYIYLFMKNLKSYSNSNSQSHTPFIHKFKTSFNVDLTNSDEVKNALLEWYVDYFTANEGKNADYVMVIMGDKYKFLNKKQFKHYSIL